MPEIQEAQVSAVLSKLRRRGVEHPAFTHIILGQAALHQVTHNSAQPGSNEWNSALAESHSAFKVLLSRKDQINKELISLPLAVAEGVAELFASRIASHCGVRTPQIRLMPDDEFDLFEQERESADAEYEVEDDPTIFCKEVSGGWCVSQKIAGSLPIFYLPEQDSLTAEWDVFFYVSDLVSKRCPVSRDEYPDFPAALESDEEIRAAARWDSDERLLGHAFRAFLNCTYAHTSNCLVDTSTKLWLIDHEKIIFRTDHSDLAELRVLIEHSDRVMQICKRISQLTKEDIEQALLNIPEPFWKSGVAIEHPVLAYHYFTTRLESWKTMFGAV